MRFLLCLTLLFAGCGREITAPKPAKTDEGCTYVQTVTQNGITVTFTHYLPSTHPLCQ